MLPELHPLYIPLIFVKLLVLSSEIGFCNDVHPSNRYLAEVTFTGITSASLRASHPENV